jgi:uncharacterized repeat protein (TIGR03803 family)
MKNSRLQTRILAILKPAVLSACLLLLAGEGTARAFTTLYSFAGGSDGINPSGLMQGADGALYGLAFGGSSGDGTVFRLNRDGTGFTVLTNFDYFTTGYLPNKALIQGTDGALYGTTYGGGSGVAGTVFKLNTDGSGLTDLKAFDDPTDGLPHAGLLQGMDGALYGTANGQPGFGAVFKMKTDGTGFTFLKKFDSFRHYSDGANPYAGLIQGTDGALYGTTLTGGAANVGTLFKLNTEGSGFTILKNLDAFTTGYGTAIPLLLGADGVIYGSAQSTEANNFGRVFRLNLDGTGFALLKNLDESTGAGPSSLIQGLDGMLYGTASGGGSSGFGTVFKLNTDGTGFGVLKNFNNSATGANPSGLIQGTDGVFYGTAFYGGGSSKGTVFKLTGADTEPPVLSVPGSITVNATSPAGAVVIFSVTATDNIDPNPLVACSFASGSTFPIGTTHVTCTATDASGNAASSGFDVVVLSASQQATSLISTVQTFNFAQGINNSLDTKLQDAQAAIAAATSGDFTSTCGYLGAFINEVQAQTGKSISASQASQLIAAATRLKSVVGCP